MPSDKPTALTSLEVYECQQAQLELYTELAKAEAEIAQGAQGVDFIEFAQKLKREYIYPISRGDVDITFPAF